MSVKTLSLTLLTAATLAACSPNPVAPPLVQPDKAPPVVQPDKAPLEKPAQVTVGVPKTGLPTSEDVLKIFPSAAPPASPGSGPTTPTSPSNNAINQAFVRMASSTTTTFESFQKSPDWVALGKFITNTTVAPALPFSPKSAAYRYLEAEGGCQSRKPGIRAGFKQPHRRCEVRGDGFGQEVHPRDHLEGRRQGHPEREAECGRP